MVMCSIHDDPEIARRELAQQIAFYSSVKSYGSMLDVNGFAAEGRAIRDAFARRDFPEMFAAVSDKMIDAMGVAGTADHVRDGLQALRRRARPHHALLTISRPHPGRVQENLNSLIQECSPRGTS